MKKIKIILLILFIKTFVFTNYSFSSEYIYFHTTVNYNSGDGFSYNQQPTYNGSSWEMGSLSYQTGSYITVVYAYTCDESGFHVVSNSGNVRLANASLATGDLRPDDMTVYYQQNGCPNLCSEKAGTTSGYNIETYYQGSSPDLSDQCIDGCAVSAEVHESLGPCVQSQCIVSVKYTYTGQPCGGENVPLDEEPPSQCYAEWTALVNQCGGASNVATFDWSTCSGECLKKDCSAEYAALADACGGYLYIASWDNTTCQGTCANFSTPDDENGDAPPSNITTTTQTNEDGSSTVTNTKTYIIDNTTYTETKTTNYDSSGNETGTSTTLTTSGSGSDDNSSDDNEPSEPTYDMPSSWYEKKYDVSNGLASAINYQQVIDASQAFQNTALYQIPNLILDCLGYVEGNGCEYPPVISVDFHNRFSSKPIEIDLSPFESVVKVMKFFFSILCIIGTGKATMAIFN